MPSKIKNILRSDFKLILMLYSDNFISDVINLLFYQVKRSARFITVN